jgi:hypothetical protein
VTNARGHSRPPAAPRKHRSARAAGRGQARSVGGPRRGPPSPRRGSQLLQRPREPARGPRQRRAPATLGAGACGPHFLMSRAPFVRRRRRSPSREGGLTSAAGAIRRWRPRVPARRGLCASARSGEETEDARVLGPLGTAGLDWARLWLASAKPGWTHVLPRRRSGALCRGSGAAEKSKHLAGFPSPGLAPPPPSRARAHWPAPPHHFGEIRLL